MKQKIIKTIEKTINEIYNISKEVQLTPAKGFGDFSTNIAMQMAKEVGSNPRDIATKITESINEDFIEKAEVAGPGFINIFLKSNELSKQLEEIVSLGEKYGNGKQDKYINVEYVSANPTGYLHVGHARGAAVGATLSKILIKAGNKVDQEYYINDAGNQIETLGMAAFIRYKQELGLDDKMPENTYKGQDIVFVAKELVKEFGDKYKESKFEDVKEIFKTKSKNMLLEIIKVDLESLGVVMDLYSSEQGVSDDGIIDVAIEKIGKPIYKKDGATWLNTTSMGDDKDRVLIKSDGNYTYFAPDIAFHYVKVNRGYDELIDIFGSDHIGYVKRMEIAVGFLGLPAERLDFLTIQLVRLIKDGKELKMSKRLGTSFTLKELIDLVGKDATRFYMINRSSSSPFDFDIDAATKQSSDNPVFTIQYTHARAFKLLETGKKPKLGKYEGKEVELINLLTKFPELVIKMANTHKVHLLPQYLIEVAKTFNSFYSNTKIIGTDREEELLYLVNATKIIIKSGLQLMDIESPNKM